MTPTIEQAVRFSCAPEVPFYVYMDSAKHSGAAAWKCARKSVHAWVALLRRSTAHCRGRIF